MGLNQSQERPELNDRELEYILLHTNYTQKQIDDIYIRFMTHYPKGYLTRQQFSQLYSSELKHLKYSQPIIERLFDHIDSDKNNQLNFKEVLFLKTICSKDTTLNEKLEWLFLLYDTNHDRLIDIREFINIGRLAYVVHGKYLSQLKEDEFKSLFKQYDIDDDDHLNCQEFIQLCKQCKDILEIIAPMFSNIINQQINNEKKKEKQTSSTNYPINIPHDHLAYLHEHTTFTNDEIKRYYSTFIRRCPKGRLDKQDFVHFYRNILPKRPNGDAESYCDFMFKAFDIISHNGFIEFHEFLLAIYVHSKGTPREKLEWIYNAYDRDSDGYINYTEINHIVHALFMLYGIDREKFSVAYKSYEIMSTLDLNNDDKLSKQEFLNVLKNKQLTEFLAPNFWKKENKTG
ncbi:unnamed protein product [Didymodactylos carnosus]|uniref:EF-hand domain-containing protein n=1 Tax=Didymodactylos carnosus TaxID=1234261 RepID=A0A813RVY6_9BILA|nr:unnamed protein product [Didymodactylos carnosus]CAF3570408.1 unnamed protein product [Didymodactylos carnosus]